MGDEATLPEAEAVPIEVTMTPEGVVAAKTVATPPVAESIVKGILTIGDGTLADASA